MGNLRRNKFRSSRSRCVPRSAAPRKLHLESLEPRCVFSVNSVTNYLSVTPEWFVAPPATNTTSGVSLEVDAAAKVITERWIVRLTPEATSTVGSFSAAAQFVNHYSASVVRGLGLPGLMLVAATDEVARQLAADQRIAYVELDQRIGGHAIPNDPAFDGDPPFGGQSQYALKNTGADGALAGADIAAPAAWDITKGSRQVVVGVIDSGIDLAHPDLALNIWINQGEIPQAIKNQLTPVDADGRFTFVDLNAPANAAFVSDLNENGYIDAGDLLADPRWVDTVDTDANTKVDDLFGWDFLQEDAAPLDEHGHGTHVAGTIGATGNNNLGVTGVSWDVSLMSLRFLDEEKNGLTSDAIEAVNYATMMRTVFNENVRVTNNSWGALGNFNQALRDAIAASGAADILFVAAAGNGNVLGEGVDEDDQPFYPASYELDNIISVAATDSRDQLALFSNFGDRSVDIAAPGVGILSTSLNGQYLSRNGTSMAAPHVAGVAALVLANKPDASAQEVREAILQGADVLPTLSGRVAGARRLNAHGALTAPTFAPRAVATADDVTTSGLGSITISVTYTDDEGVNLSSLGAGDIVVMRDGFSSYKGEPVKISQSGTGSSVTVTYSLASGWTAIHNGQYSVILQAGAVEDVTGTRVGERRIATFRVEIADPTVFFVDSTLDSIDVDLSDGIAQDAQGRTTLRAAVMQANATPGTNSIVLPDGVYVFNQPGPDEENSLTGDFDITDQVVGDLNATGYLFIYGAGAGLVTIDANYLDRVFDIKPGSHLDISGLTITHGSAREGGGIRNAGGDLAVHDSVISSNSAELSGGGLWNGAGAMSETWRTTISGNVTQDPFGSGGGGIFNSASIFLDSSTISGNSTVAGFIGSGGGGGLLNTETGIAETINVTFSGNIAINGDGGAIDSRGEVHLYSTTIADNSAPLGSGGGVFNDEGPAVPVQFDFKFGANGRPGGEFSQPNEIAVVDGRIYVVDSGNSRIQVFDADYTFLFAFGEFGFGPGQFDYPSGIAVDDAGNIYVSDLNNDRVQVFDSAGTFLFQVGGPGNAPGSLNAPFGISLDSNGRIYVADWGHGRINIYDSTGAFVSDFNVNGMPTGITTDESGKIYVSKSHGTQVSVYDPSFGLLFEFGGTGLGDGPIRSPQAIAVDDAGNIYVADSGNNRVAIFDSSGTFLFQAGSGIHGATPGSFIGVEGVAVDDTGAIYATDLLNGRVQVFDASGNFLSTFGSPGNGQSPKVVAASNEKIYVADHNLDRIQVFDLNGNLVDEFGQAGTEAGEFLNPQSMAFAGGMLYVADTDNDRIQVLRPDGEIFFSFGSSGAGIGQFNKPGSLAVSANSPMLAVVDTGNSRVQAFGTSGEFLFEIDYSTIAYSPKAIALDSQNNIYVAETATPMPGRIRVYSSTGAFLREFIQEGSGLGGLTSPQSIAIDGAGNVYVADGDYDRIQVYNLNGQFLYSLGSTGNGDGNFSFPLSIAIRSDNEIYVTDRDNDRVQAFTILRYAGLAEIGNTLVANNSSQLGSDLSGEFNSLTHNLVGVGDDTLAGIEHNVGMDLVGTITEPIDPRLGPLQNNGGLTFTHALLAGSPAIDSGDNFIASEDQLGVSRPQDGNADGIEQADIGAVERYYSQLNGVKYLDSNGNAVRDAGEPGLPNWTIYVDLNANRLLDIGEPSATTRTDDPSTPLLNEAGSFTIAGLVPDTYILSEIDQGGYSPTAPQSISDDAELTLEDIAHKFDPAQGPQGIESIGRFVIQPSLNGDTVTFHSSLGGIEAIFQKNSTGEIKLLVKGDSNGIAGTSIPGSAETFTGVGAPSFDGHTMAFVGLKGTGSSLLFGIYAMNSQGMLRKVADRTTQIPGGNGTFSTGGFGQPVAAGNIIAFRGSGQAGQFGIYAASTSGTLVMLADTNTAIPGGTGRFKEFDDGLAIEGSTYAVRGYDSSSGNILQEGIYMGSGPTSLHVVADRHTHVPGDATALFQNFGAPVLSNGRVAFWVKDQSGREGIYAGTNPGNLAKLVDTSTPIPGGQGNFTHLSRAFDLNGNDLVFVGEDATGGRAVYAMFSGQIRKVTDVGPYELQNLLPFTGVASGSLSANRIAILKDNATLVFAEFATENVHSVTLGPGDELAGLNFGARALPGEIHGLKFNDLDGDALRDANEPGLIGRTIYLDLNNNRIIDTGEPSTATDIDGFYSFTNLAALKTYSVAEVPQPGWEQTFPKPEDSGRWSITLDAGEIRTNVNFGNRQSTTTGGVGNTGRLRGRVTDSLGSPVANRRVYIDLNENRSLDAQTLGVLEPNVLTNANGEYEFTQLAAGTYTMRVVVGLNESLMAPIGNRLEKTTIPVTFEGPQSLILGQFTGDNALDLVVVNGSSRVSGANEITVLANNGAGQFTRAGNDLPVGTVPTAIASGHFNNDTFLDIAVANSYTSNVSILMGTGNSSAPFSAAVNRSVTTNPGVNGYAPKDIVSGDFNGDGKTDLAVVNESSRDISLLINNGNGVFGSPIIISLSTQNRPYSIKAGHFNSDGVLDLVVAEYNSDSNNDRLRVLLNSGSGSFTLGQAITVGNGARSVAVGHFNGDNILDLASANTLSNTVSVIMGNGNGTFGSALSLPAGEGPTTVTSVDIDGDSDLDLIVTNKSSATKAAVLRNLGNGVFAAIENLGSGVIPDVIGFAADSGDLDGDQVADLVLINSSELGNQGTVSILANDLTTGGQRRTIADGGESNGLDFRFQTISTVTGDYNGNGSVDAPDYTLWRSSFSNTGSQTADGNKNSSVDAADYVLWRKHAPHSSATAMTTSPDSVVSSHEIKMTATTNDAFEPPSNAASLQFALAQIYSLAPPTEVAKPRSHSLSPIADVLANNAAQRHLLAIAIGEFAGTEPNSWTSRQLDDVQSENGYADDFFEALDCAFRDGELNQLEQLINA